MSVCKQEDEWNFEKPQWIALLSNGEKIYQDDDRPDVEPPSAWLRLKSYCEKNSLSIVNFQVRFRSHFQNILPENAEGYFFVKRIIGFFMGSCEDYYLTGYLEGDIVHVCHWKVPEFILVETEQRKLSECEHLLIRRKDA